MPPARKKGTPSNAGSPRNGTAKTGDSAAPTDRATPVTPDAAYFDDASGEFLLPYAAVRTADDPDAFLLSFFESTYEAAAELGRWDRAALEVAP